jgi:DNA-directed RNA polymerase subunit RPC12/RpoP
LRKDASDIPHRALRGCDTQGVAWRAEDRVMTIQLSCPWCTDEVAFTIDEADEELVCSACSTRMDFAPDPGVTYELLYAAVA